MPRHLPRVGVAVVLGPPEGAEDGDEGEGEEAEDEGPRVAVALGEEVGDEARHHCVEGVRGGAGVRGGVGGGLLLVWEGDEAGHNCGRSKGW